MGEIVLYAKRKASSQCKKAIAFLNKKGSPIN